jgi:hypothetical protein
MRTRSRSRNSQWTRRRWLAAGAALLGGIGAGLIDRRVSGVEEVDDQAAEVQRRAREVGLGTLRSSVNEHYLGIGDAPDAYRNEAIKRADALAAAYLRTFQEKGFHVAMPKRRLTVVTLKDQTSYAAFLGQPPGEAVGGHYDLDANRLVVFDFRPGGNLPQGANLERINSVTLSHEATHQLTFNTGLLDRQGDVPLALSEGLAMYAELWRPDGRSVLGATNRPRLAVLVAEAQKNAGEPWIPLERLLTDDAVFDDPKTEQLAYAGSSVFVHYLLKTPGMVPKCRAYLDAIAPRRDPTRRLADATGALGDLERLNISVRKHAKRLIDG